MSVLQPISYGLVHQVGPGTGARGFGSYKADNTETIRPYQQESSSPIGRAYPMGIVSGRPTVYDPRAGMREDPVVMLLKKILGLKTAVEKAPDAGFKNNLPVFTTSGQPLEPPGRTLGAAPADIGLGGDMYQDSAMSDDPTEFFQKISNWVDGAKRAVANFMFEEDMSVIEGSAFGGGSVYGTASEGSVYGTPNSTTSSEFDKELKERFDAETQAMPVSANQTTQADDNSAAYIDALNEQFNQALSVRDKLIYGQRNALEFYGRMLSSFGLGDSEMITALIRSANERDREMLAQIVDNSWELLKAQLMVETMPIIELENTRKNLKRKLEDQLDFLSKKYKATPGKFRRPNAPYNINTRFSGNSVARINRGVPRGLMVQQSSSSSSSSGIRSGSSGSSYNPASSEDGRMETGRRTSPVNTRSKNK